MIEAFPKTLENYQTRDGKQPYRDWLRGRIDSGQKFVWFAP